jgi:hypothetical protein
MGTCGAPFASIELIEALEMELEERRRLSIFAAPVLNPLAALRRRFETLFFAESRREVAELELMTSLLLPLSASQSSPPLPPSPPAPPDPI